MSSIFDDNIDVFDGIKDQIRQFIIDNYLCRKGFTISDKPNINGLYEVSSNGDVIVKNKNITSLSNGLFKWFKVNGCFSCSNCDNIKSLEGAPVSVEKSFFCYQCDNLTSLKGSPEYIGEDFNCFQCIILKSLEGSPKYVNHSFYCMSCGIQFNIYNVIAVSDVNGRIYC